MLKKKKALPLLGLEIRFNSETAESIFHNLLGEYCTHSSFFNPYYLHYLCIHSLEHKIASLGLK